MPADTAAWAALGISLLGLVPRLVTTFSRSRSATRRAEVTRFEALYDKQDRLITRLEARCDELERELGRLTAAGRGGRRQIGSNTIR